MRDQPQICEPNAQQNLAVDRKRFGVDFSRIPSQGAVKQSRSNMGANWKTINQQVENNGWTT